MKHDMGKLAQGLHNCMQDMEVIRQVCSGMLQTIKKMPGYQEAIDTLKAEDDAKREEEAVKKVADMVEKEMDDK